MPPGDKYLGYLLGHESVVEHSTFNLGGLGSANDVQQNIAVALVSVVTAFFDAELRGRAAAVAYLASDDAISVMRGDLEWHTK